ncbi:GNAT family N-acetyltransferase [Aquiflexum sp. TKW24L]|uniref:GNAT family N-acetyltransferase n=1 Tax=Aquiflexum sp. TKW24L TaxID=2942212 RepID=UPI0020C0D6B7|nr:GNAT family N-acetyltransferase [Aquiflexum sp. TKW24L]MCL6260575.1 GNAT family N-acetyltransferase [Aquiflexum sp. TKW24L]
MDGKIKLMIDRQPDYFSLLRLKGDYFLLVALDNDKIVGAIAYHIKQVYINHSPEITGYISDLKVLPEYRNSLTTYRLLKAIVEIIEQQKIEINFILTAKGNELVAKVLEGRAGLPLAKKVCEFYVFQFLPKIKPGNSKYSIVPFQEKYRKPSIAFLNSRNSKLQFGTLVDHKEKIEGDQAWMIFHDSQIIGFVSVIDMEPYKQNVVMNIPLSVTWQLKLYRLFFPSFQPPKINKPIRMHHVKHLAVAKGNMDCTIALIHQARHYAHQKGMTFLSYGLDKKNELTKKIQPLSTAKFESEGFVLQRPKMKTVNISMPFHENFYLV